MRDAATILRAIAVIVIVGVVCGASSFFSVVMFLHLEEEEGNETNEEGGSDTRNRERDGGGGVIDFNGIEGNTLCLWSRGGLDRGIEDDDAALNAQNLLSSCLVS